MYHWLQHGSRCEAGPGQITLDFQENNSENWILETGTCYMGNKVVSTIIRDYEWYYWESKII